MKFLTPLLFVVYFLSRVVIVRVTRILPEADTYYIDLGHRLFEESARTEINLAPAYSALLYLAHPAVPNWTILSYIIYVVFSTLSAWAFYLIAKDLYGTGAARLTVLLLMVLPGFGPGVAGYSHKDVVSVFLICMFLFFGWRLLSGPATAARVAGAAAFGLLATLVRPELLLYVLGFALLQVVSAVRSAPGGARAGSVYPAVAVLALYSAGVAGHYAYLKSKSDSKTLGIFTDAKYSYDTFTHTLGIRAAGVVDPKIATPLANKAFGTAEGNGYSIVRAIRKNPKEEVKNLLFNAKEVLDNAGHPLFFPFYLYPFVGIGLNSPPGAGLGKRHAFLAASTLPCLAAILLFHLEIRYMLPLLLPVTVWAAAGFDRLDPGRRKYLLPAVLLVTAVLTAAYAQHFATVPRG